MDDMLFGAKRAYWATFLFARKKLARFGITPARINLLRVLYAAPTRRASQSYVRHHLGVARSVVSRMMRALERLGFVERDRHDDDRRTRLCKLTASGCKLVASVWSELVHSRVVAGAIDAIWRDPHETRKVALPIFEALTLSFGRWGPVVAP